MRNLIECFDLEDSYSWNALIQFDECIQMSQTQIRVDQGAGPYGTWDIVPCDDQTQDYVVCQDASGRSFFSGGHLLRF